MQFLTPFVTTWYIFLPAAFVRVPLRLSYRTCDQTGRGGRLPVLSLDVLRHEHPVWHVTQKVEYGGQVVAHQSRIGYQPPKRLHHV
jgi:hypothetical protein